MNAPRPGSFRHNAADGPLVFAQTGAYGVAGGIASANRNVVAALERVARERGRSLLVLSLLERETDRPPYSSPALRFEAFAGGKSSFSRRLLQAARGASLVCCDHVRLAVPLLPLSLLGLARTVVFAHGSEARKRLRRSSRWVFQSATLCLANSDFTRARMLESMPRIRVAACPLGLPPEFVPAQEPATRGPENLELEAADGRRRPLRDKVLLAVARMDPREREKGHRQLIRALPLLLPRYPDVQLVFPGPGDDRAAIAEYARAHGVGANVFLPGHLPWATLGDLYKHCHALVMPSRQEGFGLVYLEAMSYAKPCIGCRNQGAEDVIVDGETGYLIADPDDRNELAATVGLLLADPARARHLGKNGWTRLRGRFTAEHYQERLCRQLSPLLVS